MKRKYVSVTSPDFKRDEDTQFTTEKVRGRKGVIHLYDKSIIEQKKWRFKK